MNTFYGLIIIILIVIGFGFIFGMDQIIIPLMGSAFVIFYTIDQIFFSYNPSKEQVK